MMNPPSYDETMKGGPPTAPPYPTQAPYPTQTPYPMGGPGMPMPQQTPTMPMAGYPVYQMPPQQHQQMMTQVVYTDQRSTPVVQTYTTVQQGQFQQPPTVVLLQEPKMRAGSQRMVCPFCRADIKTRVQSVGSDSCKLITAASCFIGFLFGCCCIGLIPCLLLRKQKHFCPVCNVYLGEYNPVVCGP